MDKVLKVDAYSLLCNVRNDFEIPENLREFLSMDDQGIDGLDFMLKDSKLCRRIPSDVRASYEIIYARISEDLENELENAIKALQSLSSDNKARKEIIHKIIQDTYQKSKK